MGKIRQKAQTIVEFALVLPIFLMLLIGIIFSGFVLSDYVAMNHLARSVAREASLAQSSEYANIKDKYAKQASKNGNYLPNDTYVCNIKKGPGSLTIADKDDDVVVTVKAEADAMKGVFHSILQVTGIDKITVEYRMYNEVKGSASP